MSLAALNSQLLRCALRLPVTSSCRRIQVRLLCRVQHPVPRPVQAKGAQLVSVTSMSGCKLAQLCHMAVQLPLERELCPFDMAPVTSTAIQLLWGDTLAVALMQVTIFLPSR